MDQLIDCIQTFADASKELIATGKVDASLLRMISHAVEHNQEIRKTLEMNANMEVAIDVSRLLTAWYDKDHSQFREAFAILIQKTYTNQDMVREVVAKASTYFVTNAFDDETFKQLQTISGMTIMS